ncbi:fluoride efflux transporter CrcB [Lichenicoccus roseus]|uniref:Fluoride-specific ion channel FluC n=2 Tax=Lichenicoccus roseus TaxID=2683649 RepID=A0A5R9J065_9PROT|nr:fluoride efflux transporter CrcB [Lichenicoccus roseus]
MLNYFLIAVGGAIGSVLRAWIGSLMVALTGPAFPWGTILINIVGSFVIGFFGTLTATDGRFAVPFDIRAFVMVGICGGFTTFSSFSLQTLELARDGRTGQALGNIVLSVVLCLGSVAAAYSLALLLRTSRLGAISDAAPGTMSSSTLVALHRPESVSNMLAVADQLMAVEGGQTIALAIDGPVLADLQLTEEVQTKERRRAVSEQRRDWVKAMRSTLDGWVSGERAKGRSARWIEVHGDGTLAVAEHGRSAHLLLLEQKPGDRAARERVHEALVRSGRPILLLPASTVAPIGCCMAIAWEGGVHDRKVVRTVAPLLSKAKRVVVLQIGDAAEVMGLEDVLGGMPFEVVTAPSQPDSEVGAKLVEMAHEAGADLLVMGSYSHGSLREQLFDGATEGVLRSADLPVLMQHQDA